MIFLKKLKEVSLSILPIAIIVLIIHFAFFKFDTSTLINFLIGLVIISVGQVLFVTGVEGSVMEMGDYVGNSIVKFKNIGLYLVFVFLFGMLATIAEPDVQVLANQAAASGFAINKVFLTFLIGAGVGLAVAFALIRIIRRIDYKIVMAMVLLLIFAICAFIPDSLIALAFDAGGATTGIVTSPFLLAITAGVCKNKSSVKGDSSSDSFGVIGIASLGPVLVMTVLSLFAHFTGSTEQIAQSSSYGILIDVLIDTTFAIFPLILLFYLFDILFLKLPAKKKISLAIGSVVTFSGLYLFLFGIDFGFIAMGNALGNFLSGQSDAVVLVICVVLGFIITFTEPAVRVLGAQVEDVTHGSFKRKSVVIVIAIAMAIAILLAALKVIYNINILYILAPGYALAIILMIFSQKTFTSIAFDSGGVASGPMTAAFILPIMTGLAEMSGSALSGFGLIGIVSLLPVIVLQFIGSFYFIKIKANEQKSFAIALRVAYGEDQYSEISKLENEYAKYLDSLEMEEEADSEKS